MLKLDGRSDLYSLGCTMYHLISGQLPFKGESSMDCIVGRITGQAPSDHELRPGLPPRLVQSIEKLMATNPERQVSDGRRGSRRAAEPVATEERAPGRPAPTVAAVPSVAAVASETKTPSVTPTASVPKPVPKAGTDLADPLPLPPVRAGVRVGETEAGFAPLTLDQPGHEEPSDAHRSRSRGGITDGRHGPAFQARRTKVRHRSNRPQTSGPRRPNLRHPSNRPHHRANEGRTSGTPAADLTEEQHARRLRRVGQAFARRVW